MFSAFKYYSATRYVLEQLTVAAAACECRSSPLAAPRSRTHRELAISAECCPSHNLKTGEIKCEESTAVSMTAREREVGVRAIHRGVGGCSILRRVTLISGVGANEPLFRLRCLGPERSL